MAAEWSAFGVALMLLLPATYNGEVPCYELTYPQLTQEACPVSQPLSSPCDVCQTEAGPPGRILSDLGVLSDPADARSGQLWWTARPGFTFLLNFCLLCSGGTVSHFSSPSSAHTSSSPFDLGSGSRCLPLACPFRTMARSLNTSHRAARCIAAWSPNRGKLSTDFCSSNACSVACQRLPLGGHL